MSESALDRLPVILARLGAGAAAAAEIRADLLRRYAEPHRHYHGIAHVAALLAGLDANRDLARRPDDVEAAIWFHDAVHDPGAPDNEAASADLAERALRTAGAPADAAARVAALVRATDHRAPPADPDAALLADLDLASLGADPDTFAANGEAIRREHASLPEAEVRRGQAAFLARLLERDRIFATDRFRDRLEAAARANLRRALDAINAG